MVYIPPFNPPAFITDVCDRYFGCLDGAMWQAIIKALSVKDADGNTSLGICYNERLDCENYESAFSCLQDATFLQILKLITGTDECGRPVINVLGDILEECELVCFLFGDDGDMIWNDAETDYIIY